MKHVINLIKQNPWEVFGITLLILLFVEGIGFGAGTKTYFITMGIASIIFLGFIRRLWLGALIVVAVCSFGAVFGGCNGTKQTPPIDPYAYTHPIKICLPDWYKGPAVQFRSYGCLNVMNGEFTLNPKKDRCAQFELLGTVDVKHITLYPESLDGTPPSLKTLDVLWLEGDGARSIETTRRSIWLHSRGYFLISLVTPDPQMHEMPVFVLRPHQTREQLGEKSSSANTGIAPVSRAEFGNAKSETRDGETVIEYATYKGRPVQLAIGTDFSATLRVKFPHSISPPLGEGDDALNFLKGEVEYLISQNKPIKLGNSGLSLVFNKGFPEWGPHALLSRDGSYQCLAFARKARFGNGGTISVEGLSETEIPPYYPYRIPLDPR